MATVDREAPTTPAAAEEIAVENPATGEVIRSVPISSAEDVPRWSSAAAPPSPPGRRSASRAARACCAGPRSGWSTTPTAWSRRSSPRPARPTRTPSWRRSATSPTRSASGPRTRRSTSPTRRSAPPTRSCSGRKLVVRYAPLGLVGVIGPWNYPLSNSFGDCIPALAAGNAVILKPSEVTPLTSLLMAEAMRECGLPDGVFQVATGLGETGAALVDEVDMVMFTGSTATGQKVMERAARTLTPVSLELGGKDPMIVLADADLERAANAATYYSMQNGGQTCISVERVYVEAPVYDEFVAKVTEQGPGAAPGRAGRAGQRRRRRGHVPAAARHRLRPRRRRARGRRHRAHRRPREHVHGRALLRADRARRRRPLDGVHDRGDVRPDAADHARGGRRGGAQARQRLALRARRLGLDARTPRAARRSRAGSRRARSASTTRS